MNGYKKGETLVTARPCCVSPHQFVTETLNRIFINTSINVRKVSHV